MELHVVDRALEGEQVREKRGGRTKFPAYAKAVGVVVAGVVAWFILKAVFTFVVQPLFSIIWYAVLLAAGYWTFVSSVLEKRIPVLVANEVALEAANQGSKSVVKDRLQLVLIKHGVQTTGEVIDELWEILSPPPQCRPLFRRSHDRRSSSERTRRCC